MPTDLSKLTPAQLSARHAVLRDERARLSRASLDRAVAGVHAVDAGQIADPDTRRAIALEAVRRGRALIADAARACSADLTDFEKAMLRDALAALLAA